MPSDVSIGVGQSAAFPVTLSAAAPVGGVTVTLTSSDGSKVSISPSSVTIAAGSDHARGTAAGDKVGLGSANITASAPGYGSATRQVQTNAALSFSPENLTLSGTETKNLTLTLSLAAPTGGITVNLTSSNTGVATVPASVTIAENTTTANAPVTGVAAGSSTITAAATNVASATANVTVQTQGQIGLPSNVTVPLGQSAPFPVTLPTPAPAGGVTVTFASSDATKVAISPTTVTIAAGATTPQTQPQVTSINLGSANISASAPGYTSASQAVQVTATITLAPQNLAITGTATENLTLTVSAPAPAGGLTFNVSSTATGVATVPATVTVAQNSTTATIPVTGVAAGSAVIRASATNVPEETANVTVTAAADIILPANLVVGLGEQASFPVTLAKVAQGPVFITLATSDASVLTFNTPNVFINAGQTAPAIAPRVNGLKIGTVTVTATAQGLATATTTVGVGLGLSFVPATLDITGSGLTRSLTLTLSGPAPAGGLAVTLSSSNPGVATVPGGVTFPANTTNISVPVTSISVPVTSVALGSTTITANVNVISPGTINLPASTSVPLGQSVPFAVSLSTPAPSGGLTVTLASNDIGKATVSPTNVVIPQGQTTPAAQPQLTGVNVGAVNITASAPGFNPATRTVQVNATVTWVQPNLTIAANQTQNLQLKLSASAPVAGLTVNLSSSNPGAATVQQSVNFFPDGSEFTTVVIPVNGVAAGTTVITASGTNIPSATANVTVVGPLSITTPSLPNGQVGTAYSHTLAAAGGTGPYTWALIGGTLPGGLSLNASTGVISGTPNTVVSNSSLTFRVMDSSNPAQIASKVLGLTITNQPPSITTASLPNGQVGVAYSQTLAATGGTTPYTWALTSGTLPAGLTLNASTGHIGGTPTAVANNVQLTFRVTDSSNPAQTATKTLGLTILPAGLAITTASLPNGQVGVAYSQTLAAIGGTTPFTWALTSGTLPAGLTLNAATGQIGGTPTAMANNVQLTFRVTDSSNPAQTATKVLSLTIQPPPLSITTTALANGVVGTLYSQPLAATGGTTPYTWALISGTLPAGLTLNTSTGLIGGTPQAAVTNASLQFRVTDSSNPQQAVTRSFTLTIATGLTITTPSLANGAVGTAYSQQLAAAGGAAPYTWALTSGTLPAGLTLNASSGLINGTPSAAATNTPLTFRATDSSNPAQTATRSFALTIAPQLTITTASLPNGQATVAYSQTLAAIGGTAPYTWALVSGTLPAGLTLNAATGHITGTPTLPVASAQLTFRATDSGDPVQTATKLLSLTVTPSPVSITTTSLANGQVTVAYSQTLGATGGTTPYTWALIAGTLPGGLTLDAGSGQISGTPNAAVVNAQLTFRVTDSSNPAQTATKQLSLTVLPAPVSITTVSLPDGQVGSAYSQMLGATGGTAPYTWALTAGTLPAGLTLNAGTGQIGGTPSAPANAQLTFRVTDSSNPQQTATKQLNLTIAPSPLSITTTSLRNGQATVAYSHTAATGGTPGYTWALIAGNLPAGLTLNAATGHINGTPTGSANVTLAFRVMDSGNPAQTATKELTLNIIPSPVTITTPSPLPIGQRGSPYSAMLAATGGTPPYTWALTAGTLPNGLTFSPAGVIGGTPTVSVTNLQLTFQVSDSSNPALTATKTFALTIVAPPLVITTSSLPSGQAGVGYSAQLTATGGTTPYNWSVFSGTLPAGLILNSATGAITGTPVAAAAVSLTFRVTDSSNPLLAATSAPISLTVLPPAGPAIGLSNAAVGLGLQTPIAVVLGSPAPLGGVNVTFTSSNTNLMKVAARPSDVATTSPLIVPVTEGSTSFIVYVHGFASAGTATLNATAAGYSSGAAMITLNPSGFVLDGPNGIGAPFEAGKGQGTILSVRAARLDASMNFAEAQPLRAGTSATIALSNVPSGVGMLTSSVLISGGDSSASALFTGVNAGAATLTAAPSVGFSTPAQSANILVATVTDLGSAIPNVTVGRNLQTTAQITLTGGVAPANITFSIQTSDPTKVLLSTSPTEAGEPSINMVVPAGRSFSSEFYIYGVANSASVTYSATATGFGTVNGTVTLAPSGFIINGGNFTTSPSLGNRNLEIFSAALDASGNPVSFQELAGGISANVNVESSNHSAGTITISPVVFAGGEGQKVTQFHPVGVGSTTITASAPGYTTAAGGSVVAQVTNNQMTLCDGFPVGQHLQQICQMNLTAPAPAGGLQVTLTSNNPSLLLLSPSQTVAGSASIVVTIPEGGFSQPSTPKRLETRAARPIPAQPPAIRQRPQLSTLHPLAWSSWECSALARSRIWRAKRPGLQLSHFIR